MLCRQCGVQIPEGSAFCNACGNAQAQPAAPLAPPQAPAPGQNAPEETIWTGRWSARATALEWLLWVLWVGLLAVVYVMFLQEQPRPVLLALVAVAVLPALVLLLTIAIHKLTVSYRLSTHRFFRRRGIFSRRLDELELIRVDDVAVTQNFMQRMFGVGTVTILSTDQTDPRLAIVGIEDPVGIKEQIRNQVRARRGRTTFL